MKENAKHQVTIREIQKIASKIHIYVNTTASWVPEAQVTKIVF